MSKLNNDIFFLILKELNDDKKSLFSCLLVNKLWFQFIVPILWKYPTRFAKKNLKRKKLFDIIILHLPETSKKLLINENPNIISTRQQKQKLSLNYICFCECIDIEAIFPYKYRDFSRQSQEMLLLEREIYKLFINECSNIKYLCLYKINHPIHQFLGANICFSNMTELDCGTDIMINEALYGLAQICRLIEKIQITLSSGDNPGLAKLIEMQKQIKYIRIYEGHNHEMLLHQDHKEISQALEKHAHSILYLYLWIHNGSFLCHLLPKLINLKTLKIYCSYKNHRIFERHLRIAVYSKLQILDLKSIPLYIVTKIIQNINENIWQIKIRIGNSKLNSEQYNQYLQSIYRYCPDIKYVSIFLSDQNMDEFEYFLISCQYLEAIDINGTFDCDKFLDLFVKLAPISLYKIHISSEIFNTDSLKLFFNNCKDRKYLHLYNHLSKWDRFGVSSRDWLKKYKVEGVVVHERCNGFWNDHDKIIELE